MKWREVEAEQRQSLAYKVGMAWGVLAEAFERAGRPALAFSGGKDSTVLLDLVRRFFPEQLPTLVVIYGNTGMEFPSCVKFARGLAREWDLDFHEARPGKIERTHFKYQGQRRIWEHLVDSGQISQVLKEDGRLKSTLALERACPVFLQQMLKGERLVWREGMRKSFWWCVDQYGWPLLGKSWSKLKARRINIDTFLRFSKSNSHDVKLLAYYDVLRQVKISQACCDVLKKEPAERVQAELGVDLILKGLMASESRSRAKNFLTRGYLFEGAKREHLHGAPFFHCQPMAVWNDHDVWEYIRLYDVPYAPLYDRTFIARDETTQHIKRNGCMFCSTDLRYADNHLYALRQTHPKAWDTVMRRGLGDQIRRLQRALRSAPQLTLFDQFTTEELIDVQPCVFDDLDGLGGHPAHDGLAYDPEI